MKIKNIAESREMRNLWLDACDEASIAMDRWPAPNCTITKVAEESGEVVKEALRCVYKEGDWDNLRQEMVQTIAMIIRLYVEGDAVHGLPPVMDKV